MSDFQTLSISDLDDVTGAGVPWGAIGRVAGRVGSKFVPVLNAASTAYSAYEAGSAIVHSRQRGDSWGRSLWNGAKAFVVGE